MLDANQQSDDRLPALLLLGPTGAGKTPLGEHLEEQGLGGRQCFHFDFGANLRQAAHDGAGAFLTAADQAVIRHSLETGALLEKQDFYIAANILRAFVSTRGIGVNDLVVLNGLPRHVEQTAIVDEVVSVACVVYLACEPDVVLARIEGNTGGDRAGRSDDAAEAVTRKLEIFRTRTRPLLDHYRSERVYVQTACIGVGTMPRDVIAALDPARIWSDDGAPERV